MPVAVAVHVVAAVDLVDPILVVVVAVDDFVVAAAAVDVETEVCVQLDSGVVFVYIFDPQTFDIFLNSSIVISVP